MACEKCKSSDVRKTEESAFTQAYKCKSCGHEYERVNQATARVAVGVGIAVATGGALIL
jgi:transposase-like protein